MRKSLMVLNLALFFAHLEPAAAAPKNATCGFPFPSLEPQTDDPACKPALNQMFPCLAFLLAGAARPSDACCAGVLDAWARYPACLCRLTYYPPGNISVALQQSMPALCNLTADLCGRCPAELGFAAGSSTEKSTTRTVPLVAVLLVCVTAFVALAISLLLWRKRLRSRSLPQLHADRDEIMKMEGRPTIFAYNVLKAATNSFHLSSKLGEGGFGVVYKGVLADGSEVAVKQLSAKSRQGNEEFLNEVTLITGVQHRNLVKLRGCCLKGPERLLVYEFLPNKSLYQALFAAGQKLQLEWAARVNILVGTARGLAYLHDGCQTRIVHRDIKSSNILLDKDLTPKIADFGLARLVLDDQSHVSTRVAGTAGYLAPEYAMRGQLTEKADVFSFGIVALELVSGRSNFNVRLPSEQAYLLDWTWKLHDEGRLMELLDPSLKAKPYPEDEVTRVIEVALLCTQSMASKRPSMSCVVSMLAGDVDVETADVAKPSVHMFSESGLSSASGGRPHFALGYSSSQSLYPSHALSSPRDHSNISVVHPR